MTTITQEILSAANSGMEEIMRQVELYKAAQARARLMANGSVQRALQSVANNVRALREAGVVVDFTRRAIVERLRALGRPAKLRELFRQEDKIEPSARSAWLKTLAEVEKIGPGLYAIKQEKVSTPRTATRN